LTPWFFLTRIAYRLVGSFFLAGISDEYNPMSSAITLWFNRSRENIEQSFARWGDFCFRHPWWIILFVLANLAFFGSYLPRITVDTSTEGFLHPDDPTRVTYDHFQREFSRDDRALIIVETEGEITQAKYLKKLKALHEEL